MFATSDLKLFRLPNELTVFGLNENDTHGVYRDIFEEDCYRRHGINIRDGDCILDVGANTGLFVLFLHSLGVKTRIYALEPVPAIFHALQKNVETNNHLPVHLFNIGLARESGRREMAFYPRFSQASTLYPDESTEGAQQGREFIIEQLPTLPWPLRIPLSLLPRWLKHFIAERIRRHYLKKEIVTCQMWNLSDFLRQHRIGQVDLLKVDAEHCEQEILEGLAEEDWPKIRQIVVEVHGNAEAVQAMAAMLRQRGFQAAMEPNPAMPALTIMYGVRYPKDMRIPVSSMSNAFPKPLRQECTSS